MIADILIALVSHVPLALFRGWVIVLLWQWYAVYYFEVPELTTVQAVGLSILASMFTSRIPSDEERERSMLETIMWSASYPLLALTFGWLWSFAR